MKTIGIILLVMLLLFVASQIWANNQVKDIEDYPYTVIRTIDNVEVRNYEAANFLYVTMDSKGYKESSSRGFSMLAGYIFGGNDAKQEFAMTSPVEMEMSDSVTMKFLVPSEYDLNEMPEPNNAEVHFKREEARTLAAITFGGFANEQSILLNKNALYSTLDSAGIEHTGMWSFMGYDPPFKATGRRNEVVVELAP